MTIQASTLRPGLLVSLKTSLRGNVQYKSRDIESDHLTADGTRQATWQTERTVFDPVEHESAIKARGKARSLITGVCANSAFGLLCPESGREDLERAIASARETVETFNRSASLSRIGLYVIIGRVAADDVEAMRAINSEIRDLLADMESGVSNLDASVIRAAALKLKSIGQMLQPEATARVQIAIEAARKTAKAIVAAGENAAQEIDRRTLATLAEARTAFLDIEPIDAIEAVAMPETESRALDLAPIADAISAPEPTDTPAAIEPTPAVAPSVPASVWDFAPTLAIIPAIVAKPVALEFAE